MPLSKKFKDDSLDAALRKLHGTIRYDNANRIPEVLRARLLEKFPQHNKAAQTNWVIRQMEALKDVFLDATGGNLRALIQYRATLVTIRDTIYLRDNGIARKGRPPSAGRNPLKGMLSPDQEREILKARKAKNGAANETEET